jgi:FAD/FMN-containing dehydrogenase
MAIVKEAYKALEAIVGPKYISDDPAVCEGYRSGPGGYESGLGYERVMTKIPAVVILPRNTEEVQRIVKVCNRYKVPYVPYSTGFYGPRSHCHVDNELLVDLKRLNDFEIDEKHFYAVVGSGVVYSPLQEEAMKRGAYVIIGGGGAQASVIANLIGDGWSPLSHRIGLPHRRILGTEVVLPDGELLRLGTLAVGEDPFWGDGIAQRVYRVKRMSRHRHKNGREASPLPAGASDSDRDFPAHSPGASGKTREMDQLPDAQQRGSSQGYV